MRLDIKDKLFVGLFSIGWSVFSYSAYKLGTHFFGAESYSVVKHFKEVFKPIVS